MPRRSKKQQLHNLVDDSAQSLLANIRFSDVDHPIRTVVITSSIPNEGKTFVSVNLAKAMAGSGRTCLLVEGDLRKRSLAATIGVHPRHGIYSVISGQRPLDEVAVRTSQPGLFFLDAEPRIPNPPDFLGSRHYTEFLHQATNSYDYVVIDTPPVGTFVDAAVVATEADATFLVVRENFTRRNIIRHTVEQLKAAGADLKGVILNDCSTKDSDSSGYYDYYSYYSDDSKGGQVSAAGKSSFQASAQDSRSLPPMRNATAPTVGVSSASSATAYRAPAATVEGSPTAIRGSQESSVARRSTDFLMQPPSPDDLQDADIPSNGARHARHSRAYPSRG